MKKSGSIMQLVLPVFFLFFAIALTAIYYKYPPSDSASGSLIALSGNTMGTQFRVLLHADALHTGIAKEVLGQEIQSRLDYLDKALMSTYEPNSQLSRINQLIAGENMSLAIEMTEVLIAARQINLQSNGAFDITIKELVDLWGFGAQTSLPPILDQQSIEQALTATGMHKLIISEQNNSITKLANVSLDLSALAKGYAVEQVAKLLEARGILDYLVEIGGELALKGKRQEGKNWRIGIENPVRGATELFQEINTGEGYITVAASGNYRNYFIHDGQLYSHTIDPLTGRPVTNNLASVTVVSDNAMQADGWATALQVLGAKKGMALANELQLAAFFIGVDSSEFIIKYSKAFEPYLAVTLK